jgi:hypothetical protein
MEVGAQVLLASMRCGFCQPLLSFVREYRTCHSDKCHWSQLPIAQWPELWTTLSQFRATGSRAQALYFQFLPENVIFEVLCKPDTAPQMSSVSDD